MFIDAHLHTVDPDFRGYSDIGDAELLLSCASKRSDWETLEGSSKDDRRTVPFFGIHPWYVSEDSTEGLRNILERSEQAHVGEIGLDLRRGDLESQMGPFIEQMDIAVSLDRLVAIHSVGCDNELLKVLRNKSARCILHSFSGPSNYVRPFTECGCYFSISPRLFMRTQKKASEVLSAIPPERLLIESDAPMKDTGFSMHEHAGMIGKVLEMSSDEVLALTSENVRYLLNRS